MASASARGPTADGRLKPDLVCPGWNVRSARAGGSFTVPQCTAAGAVVEQSGTSMAAPACAGAAALARQYLAGPAGRAAGAPPAPSAALVKAVLLHGGRPAHVELPDGAGYAAPPAVLPDLAQGFGRLDLASVLPLGPQGAAWPFNLSVWDREPAVDGGTWARCLRIEAASAGAGPPLRATLVWTDPPAAPGAARALINDLDLLVTGPAPGGGRRAWHGNGMTQKDEALGERPLPDRLNNCEQVRGWAGSARGGAGPPGPSESGRASRVRRSRAR